jgi:hypothetical protein
MRSLNLKDPESFPDLILLPELKRTVSVISTLSAAEKFFLRG